MSREIANSHLKNSDNHKEFGNNPSQYMRSIRFRSDTPAQQSECFKKLLELDSGERFDLKKLSTQLNQIKEDLENILYFKRFESEENGGHSKNENDDYKFNNKISVKIAWLTRYHKNIFYSLIKKDHSKTKQWNLSKDLKDIHEFNENFESLKEMVKNIEKSSKAREESQHRGSDISYSIKILNKKYLPYFINFLKECKTSDAELDQKIDELQKLYDKEIQEILKQAENYYLSNDSSGVEIAKASFNYYTVNKKPKEYYENKLENANEKLTKKRYSTLSEKNNQITLSFEDNSSNNDRFKWDNDVPFTFKSKLETEWVNRWVKKKKNLKTEFKHKQPLTLERTYAFMKAFKAEQKSIFDKVITHLAKGGKEDYKVKNENHFPCGYAIPFNQLNGVDKINNIFSLFQFRDHWNKYYKNKYSCKSKDDWYKKFINLSKNISNSNKDKHNKNQLQEIKKERGNFSFGNKCYFKEYGEFCEAYKKVAQKLGRLKAEIKGLEKEKWEAEQTSYWSLIYKENDQKNLWLVPKEKMRKLHDKVNEIFKNQKNSNIDFIHKSSLYSFESLTMRALHKLCFSEESTFVKEMPEDLKKIQKDVVIMKTKKDDETIDENELKKKNQKKLEFLKKLVKSDYFKRGEGTDKDKDKGLHLENFKLDWVDNVADLEEFELQLEKHCYFQKIIYLSNTEKESFINDYDITVLNITSYDIEGRNKKNHPISKNKHHTDLWESFWNSNGDSSKNQKIRGFDLGKVRLNPEIKIYYRKACDKLKNYFNQKNFPETFKHRKKQSQITLAFTLTLNAGKKYEDLAFSKPEEIAPKIDEFNARLNQKLKFETAWKYGIDRGQEELATLCIAKKDKDEPQIGKFVCYTLKDYKYSGPYKTKFGKEKEGCAIKNLSNFIDQTNLFEEKRTSCLDLTTAKVIKDKIVTNGDVKTYLKLKKESAKRKLYELYSQEKLEGDSSEYKLEYIGDEKDNEICIKHHNNFICSYKGNPITVYHYCSEYNSIVSKDEIQKCLSSYLEELIQSNHSKHTPSIEKINHLRDAITANMVGVICHLQKQYPGFILLEDLDKGTIDSHFGKSNENIGRRLEYKLYNKFQSFGLVPPHIKNIIQLREDLRRRQEDLRKKQNERQLVKSSQIGAIVFVDEEHTSKTCPSCVKIVEHDKEKRNRFKYEQKRFYCNHCGFDTYLFKSETDRVEGYKHEVNVEKIGQFQHLKDIDDPDKVASYNIAVKIKNSDKIGKWQDLIKNNKLNEQSKNRNKNKSKNKHGSH